MQKQWREYHLTHKGTYIGYVNANKITLNGIDDIITFPPDLETHLKHLTEVLSRLKLEKCKFCITYLNFLEHRISSDGILVDPKKSFLYS